MIQARHLALPAITLGLVAITIITYVLGASGIATLIASASLIALVFYIITSLLIAMVLTFKWRLILNTKGIEVPYWRLFSYRLMGYSVSYLTPTAHVGGEPIRAYLLKREGVHLNTAFSTVIIDKSIEVFADCLFFFIGVVLIVNSVEIASSMKLALVCISLIMILLALMFVAGLLSKKSMFLAIFRFLKLHKIQRLRHIEKNLVHVEQEVELFYRKEKGTFLLIVLMMVLLWGLMFLEYRFALLVFGHIATPMQIFLILTGVSLAYSVPVPAAIGMLELGQVSAAKVLSLSVATGLALSLLVRLRDLTWTVAGLLLLGTHKFNFSRLSKQTQEIDEDFEHGDLFKRRT